MKRSSILFLQAIVLLVSIATLTAMVRLPLMEGRAENLDLVSIYTDPFILYGYAVSAAFFVALYKTFRLLGYIGQNKAFTSTAVGALKSIRYCAVILSIAIAAAGIYIRIFHNIADDPTGFLVLCFVSVLTAVVVATAAAVFKQILQEGLKMQSQNEQIASPDQNFNTK